MEITRRCDPTPYIREQVTANSHPDVSFTLDNNVTVERGGSNKGIRVKTSRFLVFIPQMRLAKLAQDHYDEIHRAVR